MWDWNEVKTENLHQASIKCMVLYSALRQVIQCFVNLYLMGPGGIISVQNFWFLWAARLQSDLSAFVIIITLWPENSFEATFQPIAQGRRWYITASCKTSTANLSLNKLSADLLMTFEIKQPFTTIFKNTQKKIVKKLKVKSFLWKVSNTN